MGKVDIENGGSLYFVKMLKLLMMDLHSVTSICLLTSSFNAVTRLTSGSLRRK